jgi:hypothetical protein
VEVRVRIAAGGAVAGEPVRVQLLAEDKRVEVQTVVPPAADRNRETASDVTFQYTPRRRGPVRLTARVDTGVREVTQANNERTELLRVQDEAMQVLYLEGRLRWDYRALREALGDLPAMRLYTVRGFVPGVDALEASRRLWPGSHVIIAGELPQMNEDQAKALQRLVADGLGLLVVAGPDGFTPDVAGGLWEQVLPAVVERGETARGELRVVPAEAGERILPDLRQVARQVGDVPTAAWDALPPLAARAPVKQLKRNARVLLKTFDGEPLLVTGRFGLGRTAVLLTGDSHRWTRGDAFARAVHRQLILHLVSYLAGRDPVSRHQLRVRLSANRIAAGETVLVEAAYEPAGGAAVGSTNLVAELLPWPDRDGEPPLQRVRLTAGEELWSGEVRALQPGNYDVRVRAVDRASDDTVTQTAEPLLVADSRPEWQRLAADYATLRLLAQRTGGQTLAPDAAEDWTALLAQQIQPRTVRRVERHPLWDQIWLLALLVLALAGEWALRRV